MICRVFILDRYARKQIDLEPDRPSPSPLEPDDRELWGKMGGSDDPLALPEALPGWHRVLVVDRSETSQFDTLHRLLAEGFSPPGPVACFALEGREFHGHRGRSWTALRGNIHLSVAFCPPEFPARDALAFVVLPAVATVDAVRAVTGRRIVPKIKWVNDLMLDDAKVAGVLTATASQADLLTHAVVGVGLNVESTPHIPPTPFVPAVTSLAKRGAKLRHQDLIRPLLGAILSRYEELLRNGPAGLIDAYRTAADVVGRKVVIYPEGIDDQTPVDTWPEPIARGRVEAIRDDLSLLLEGRSEPIARGRLTLGDI